MNRFESVFCKITVWTYQYFYNLAKDEYNGDGEDTKELAYQYTHDLLANVGFISAELETDRKLRIRALDPASFLAFNKNGVPELYELINNKLTDTFGLYFLFKAPSVSDGYVDNVSSVSIYSYTKPFLESLYMQIKDGELTWEEAFELEIASKDQLLKEREELVEKVGNLQNKKRVLVNIITEYKTYIESYKKTLTEKNLRLDMYVCYKPNSLAQQTQANYLFYKKGIKDVCKENNRVTKELKEASRKLAKIEQELKK